MESVLVGIFAVLLLLLMVNSCLHITMTYKYIFKSEGSTWHDFMYILPN